MKQILLAALAALLVIGCDTDDDNNKNKLQGNYNPVYINSRANNKAEDVSQISTHDLLVSFKDDHLLRMTWEVREGLTNGNKYHALFGHDYDVQNIDTVNDRLIMEAGNVIDHDRMRKWGGVFLSGRNYVFTDKSTGDTLAYIPNNVIREGEKKILDLWVKGEIDAIYSSFYDLFYFKRCTGEEFRSIKEKIDWTHEFDFIAEHAKTHEIRWDDNGDLPIYKDWE